MSKSRFSGATVKRGFTMSSCALSSHGKLTRGRPLDLRTKPSKRVTSALLMESFPGDLVGTASAQGKYPKNGKARRIAYKEAGIFCEPAHGRNRKSQNPVSLPPSHTLPQGRPVPT